MRKRKKLLAVTLSGAAVGFVGLIAPTAQHASAASPQGYDHATNHFGLTTTPPKPPKAGGGTVSAANTNLINGCYISADGRTLYIFGGLDAYSAFPAKAAHSGAAFFATASVSQLPGPIDVPSNSAYAPYMGPNSDFQEASMGGSEAGSDAEASGTAENGYVFNLGSAPVNPVNLTVQLAWYSTGRETAFAGPAPNLFGSAHAQDTSNVVPGYRQTAAEGGGVSYQGTLWQGAGATADYSGGAAGVSKTTNESTPQDLNALWNGINQATNSTLLYFVDLNQTAAGNWQTGSGANADNNFNNSNNGYELKEVALAVTVNTPNIYWQTGFCTAGPPPFP